MILKNNSNTINNMLTNNTSDSKEIKISAVNTDVLNSVESKKALENDQGKQLLN